jgi:hypothetical protein
MSGARGIVGDAVVLVVGLWTGSLRIACPDGTNLVDRTGEPPDDALRLIRTEYSRILHGSFTASGYLIGVVVRVRFDRAGSRTEPRERVSMKTLPRRGRIEASPGGNGPSGGAEVFLG